MDEKTLNLAAFAENPDNPSTAADDAIARLMKKLRKVPDGLKASRIAYVSDYVTRAGADMSGWLVVLSGNKRLRVLKEIYGENADVPAEWFQDITSMPKDRRREFIINMNVNEGEWVSSVLMRQYSRDELKELMGKDELDAILSDLPRPQTLAENEEIEPGEFASEMTFKFSLTRAERDRAIEKLMPKVAILENVSGIVKGNARDYCRRILARLSDAGYATQVFLLNAATMGVPQTRQRTFFIARRRDLGLPPLKLKVCEPPVPFSEIADSKPAPETLTAREYALWLKRRPSDTGFDDIAKRVLGKGSYFNTRLVHSDRVAPTICAANSNALYDAPRHMTRTELLLAASFPLDYSCSTSKLRFAIGMSVAPVQMAHVASAIKEQWLTKGDAPCSRNVQ